MSRTRWFEWLRCGMLVSVMAWTYAGLAQEAARSRREASSGRPIQSPLAAHECCHE